MANAILPYDRLSPLKAPLTVQQEYVALLVGLRLTYVEIGEELGVAASTARTHVEDTAAKIGGDLPAYSRVLAWVRGADADVLTGTGFHTYLRQATGRSVGPARASIHEKSYDTSTHSGLMNAARRRRRAAVSPQSEDTRAAG